MNLTGHPDANNDAKELHELLSNCLERELGKPGSLNEAAILFSGGVDSALLAHIVNREFFPPKLYSVGFEGSNDIVWSGEAADLMGLPIEHNIIHREDIETAIQVLASEINMTNPKWMAVFIPLYLGLASIKEDTVIMGQGADEVFGGYRKYREAGPGKAEDMMARDISEIIEGEAEFYHGVAGYHGKRLILPFLDPEIIVMGKKLPYERKIDGRGNKLVVRDLCEELGLPEEISQRPKKAMQYGTGVSRELRKILKTSGMDLGELISSFQ